MSSSDPTPPDSIHPDGAEPSSPVLSERGFWLIFTGGWLVLLSVDLLASAASGEVSGERLTWGLVFVLPLAVLSVPIALLRRRLLEPDRSLAATAGLHVGVGLAYALLTAGAMTGLVALVGDDPMAGEVGTGAVFLYRMVSAGFLYVIFAGFLMWTESLRRVHESRALAAREAVLRAQAEAKALRAQFNPHFVFNTLHSLMLLVRADPAAAERAIEDVATLIRYASILQRREVDLVPLTKELAVADRYLGLEELRLEDRLSVDFEVEVEPATVALPAFALQTLLENAIKHGLEPAAEGGRVRVAVGRVGAHLVLEVADDGAGAEPSAVEGASGHGLDLLRRRLEALYGGEASLAWTTAPGQGFRVVLTLPWRTPPEAAGLESIPDAVASR